ncbi:plasmid maintenance protein [Borreliella garinii]
MVLISTLEYINIKYKKYTQKTILYYFNENLKRNGQATTTLRTLQKYLYRLEKDIKVTTNYYKHLGVNFGTEIYYHLNCEKNECHFKINQYFQEKKHSRFKSKVNNYLKYKSLKKGNVELGACLCNKNNIKEEKKKKIEKFQITKYSNKCNFKCKEILPFILKLDVNKDSKIKMLKVSKIIEIKEIKLLKHKGLLFNKSCFKEKQKKLKEILENTKKQLEKNGYNAEQLVNKSLHLCRNLFISNLKANGYNSFQITELMKYSSTHEIDNIYGLSSANKIQAYKYAKIA